MKRQDIAPIIEALETDNTSALRQIGREQGLDIEALLYRILEGAGVVYATKREPSRSDFFTALMTIGKELDSEAIAWGIQERKRRTDESERKTRR